MNISFSAIYGLPPQLNVRISDQLGVKSTTDLVFTDLNTSSFAYNNRIGFVQIDNASFSGGILGVNLDYQKGADAQVKGIWIIFQLLQNVTLKGW